MKYFGYVFAVLFGCCLCAGQARAEQNPDSPMEDRRFLLSPSLTEVLYLATKEENPESGIMVLKPARGFYPYIGFANLHQVKIDMLEPGKTVDMMGGLGYYAPRRNGGGFSFIFAVKDTVPTRFEQYRPDPTNITPYLSLSIHY